LYIEVNEFDIVQSLNMSKNIKTLLATLHIFFYFVLYSLLHYRLQKYVIYK